MAAIALRTAGDISLDVVEKFIFDTQPAGVALNAGDLVGYDANGAFTTAGIDQASAANARIAYGIVLRKVAVGESVTAVRKGVIDGFNLDALAYNAALYTGTGTGTVETAAGVAGRELGRVIPARGNLRGGAADKVLFVDL